MTPKRKLVVAGVVAFCGLAVILIAVPEEDPLASCVEDTAREFRRSLPGYVTPAEIVERAEWFCEDKQKWDDVDQSRENEVDRLLKNR